MCTPTVPVKSLSTPTLQAPFAFNSLRFRLDPLPPDAELRRFYEEHVPDPRHPGSRETFVIAVHVAGELWRGIEGTEFWDCLRVVNAFFKTSLEYNLIARLDEATTTTVLFSLALWLKTAIAGKGLKDVFDIVYAGYSEALEFSSVRFEEKKNVNGR